MQIMPPIWKICTGESGTLLMPPAEAQAVPRTSRAGPSPSDPARRRGGRSQSNGLGLGPGGGGGMAQAQLA